MAASLRSMPLRLAVVVLAAIVLRVIDFPGRYVRRDFDERPYVEGGVALWEGITPTYCYAPAGIQTWISWLYSAGSTARYVIHPSAEERAAPLILRPYVAGNHALFNIYRDWSIARWVEIAAGGIVMIAAAAAGFKLGEKRGGWMAAILVGGTVAVLPLFVDLSGQARPYAMAWGFGIIALYYAAVSTDRVGAWWRSAVCMGLAITCRIDMLLVLPLAWADVWDVDRTWRRRVGRIVQYTIIAAIVSYLISPWLITNLAGNLRAIGTVRVASPEQSISEMKIIKSFMVHQGLCIDLILMLCAMFLAAPDKQRIRWCAASYVLLLSLSVLKGTGFSLRYQGAAAVALVTFGAVGMAAIARRWPKVAAGLLVIALAIPGGRTIYAITLRKSQEIPYHATDWVERHVPPGTRVYLSPDIRDPLPTAAASRILWEQVEGDAWITKLQSAIEQFDLNFHDYPRAFSNQMMIVERGLRREWFILGSRRFLPDPRFDVRIFSESTVFSVEDISAEFKKTGGVLICNDIEGAMPTDVGTPVVQWVDSRGRGVRIYCSADVRERLLDQRDIQAW